MKTTNCVLCGKVKECFPKEIERVEYDVCAKCWDALSRKLEGKGRKFKRRTTVFVPPPETRKEQTETPDPHEPPKIWFTTGAQSK